MADTGLRTGRASAGLLEPVQVEAVEVESDEAALRITVRYVLRRTGERRTATFTREV